MSSDSDEATMMDRQCHDDGFEQSIGALFASVVVVSTQAIIGSAEFLYFIFQTISKTPI